MSYCRFGWDGSDVYVIEGPSESVHPEPPEMVEAKRFMDEAEANRGSEGDAA